MRWRRLTPTELRRQRKRELRVHENTRLKSEQQLHAEGRMAAKQAAILVVSVLVTLGMLGGVLFTFAQKNKLNHEVASINRQISEAQSDTAEQSVGRLGLCGDD